MNSIGKDDRFFRRWFWVIVQIGLLGQPVIYNDGSMSQRVPLKTLPVGEGVGISKSKLGPTFRGWVNTLNKVFLQFCISLQLDAPRLSPVIKNLNHAIALMCLLRHSMSKSGTSKIWTSRERVIKVKRRSHSPQRRWWKPLSTCDRLT